MQRIILAACLTLSASAATAQELAPDLEQLFTASQLALQRMSGAGGNGAIAPAQAADVPIADATSTPLMLNQTGMNAVNVVNSDLDLGSVYQNFDGRQIVDNVIDVYRPLETVPISIDQTGANYANMMQGNTISMADQAMLDGARQIVSNSAWTGGSVGNIQQTGTNVANIAMAEFAIDAANQVIGHDVVQKVWNYIEFDADTVVAGTVTQSGGNIGNVLVADRIDHVTREFYGDQIVRNEIVLHGPTVPMITQSGSNIANLVVANHIGAVYQISSGRQLVENIVVDGAGNPIDSGNIEQTELNYQGASNVVNMMVLRAQRQGATDPQQPVAVSQDADFPQAGQGASGQSQTGNVTVIVR